jgi:hypothetical protein
MGGGGGASDLRAKESETERIVIVAIIGKDTGFGPTSYYSTVMTFGVHSTYLEAQ